MRYESPKPENTVLNQEGPRGFFLDLVVYVSVMFLVREIYVPSVGFMANGLFYSFSTLAVASWRMRARGVTWNQLGLRKPTHLRKTFMVSGLILGSTVVSIVAFQIIKDQLPFLLPPDTSGSSTASKFGELKGNWGLFLLIIPAVWIESMLEELLDRGFLLTWLERSLSKTSFATVLAVILQAVIFGFRHSYDLSERSVTVGIIGLVMGVAYVTCGRSLWPLIVAHCALNTLSMVERVL